jgi:hypothetical protein
MQVTRTVELGAAIEDVQRFLADHERLVDWIGEELRGVEVRSTGAGLTWTWTNDGMVSTVELTVDGDGERSTVSVVERAGAGAGASASCCARRWDDHLLDLELRALTWQHRLARVTR